MFAAKGIFEPPKYFPFGTGHNWEVKITCKTYFNEIAVEQKKTSIVDYDGSEAVLQGSGQPV